ncbi:hypothetical protein ACOSP7_029066 [Xanthoceras sorbifolium]
MGKRKQPAYSSGEEDSDYVVSPPKRLREYSSCILKFDGASKGNPGRAGAGAVLLCKDDSGWLLREGLGIATNSVAEYRALILGLKYALERNFTDISVNGDSKLVCMQVQGLWKINNQNLAKLCREARELIDEFQSFEMEHIRREFNSAADAQANLAIHLSDGEVEVDRFY